MTESPANPGPIVCVGVTPAAQRVMVFKQLQLDAVNRAATTVDGAAGKAVNVAKVLSALGEFPLLATFLGGDRGDALRAELTRRGIELEFVAVPARTRQCITVLDQEGGTQTELVEESQAVPESAYTQLETRLRPRIASSRAVVMSGTLTPGAPADFYARCTRLAKDHGALTVVDAQGQTLREALTAKPVLVKPNRAELAATLGRPITGETDLAAGVRELHDAGAERVVITAGAEPALAFDGQRFWRVHSPRITAVNPIGSGDAFTAGLVWRLLRGDDLGEAVRWAAAAGAANALTLMAGEVERGEVERLAATVRVESLS